MEINFDLLPSLIGTAVIIFAVYMLMYYKFIYSVIDPLFSWIFTTAFASVLVIEVIPEFKDVIHFFGCQIALWLGFLIAYYRHEQLVNYKKIIQEVYSFSNQSFLRWITYILFIVYITSNFVIWYSKGFALLSETPTEAKFLNFQEGFGLFRKINWSTGTFVSTSLIFMYVLKRKNIDLIFLTIVIGFYSLEGSKSALLKIAIAVGVVLYHPAFIKEKNIIRRFQQYLPLVFFGIMGIFFTVLLKENDGIDETFIAFFRRLLYSADSVLYFYTPINLEYFSKYSYLDYFPRLVNPILGFLRIQPYQEALGNIMYDNLRPSGSTSIITVGPNAPFYIEGRIFFYYWVAFPYSMLIGYLYASIRIYFFSITQTSAFYFVFMGSVCQLASAMIVDMNLALTVLFDLFFFVIPPFIIISLILKRHITVRIRPNTFKFIKYFWL